MKKIVRLYAIIQQSIAMIKILLILSLISTSCYGQAQDKFVITEIISKDSFNKLNKSQFKIDRNNIFEDSNYTVYKSCAGEWGGIIIFMNKKTGKRYSAASNCPVAVNKINGSYFITSTLNHIRGSSKILEIRNPDEMNTLKSFKTRKGKESVVVQHFGEHDIEFTKGVTKLVDSVGVLTLTTFPLHGHLYHIVTDFNKTYLTQVVYGKFATIDTISNESLWTFEPEVFITSDKHSIIFFKNDKVSGYIDIFDNKIKVVRRK